MTTNALRIGRLSGIGASLVVALSSLSGCIIGGSARYKETRSLSVSHDEVAPISVTTKNGSVAVRHTEYDDVSIEATIRARSLERLEQVEIVTSTLADGTLAITVEWPDGRRRNNEGVSFDIRVPDVDGVSVRTGNGRITVENLAGPADLRTSNGRIVVNDHVGPILADTSNGRIEIANATDSVDAETSNGRVRVSLTPDNPGPVRIDTSNGSVGLQVGPAFEGRLVLDTSNGRIRLSNAPPARIETVRRTYANLVIGEDSQRSRVDTSNGSITVEFGG